MFLRTRRSDQTGILPENRVRLGPFRDYGARFYAVVVDAYRTLKREAEEHNMDITVALRDLKVTIAPKAVRSLLDGVHNALAHFNGTKTFERKLKKDIARFCRKISTYYAPRSLHRTESLRKLYLLEEVWVSYGRGCKWSRYRRSKYWRWR